MIDSMEMPADWSQRRGCSALGASQRMCVWSHVATWWDSTEISGNRAPSNAVACCRAAGVQFDATIR